MKVAQAAMCRTFEACLLCAYWRVMVFCRVAFLRLCACLFCISCRFCRLVITVSAFVYCRQSTAERQFYVCYFIVRSS